MFRIREATEADNEALLHLEAQSPQGSGISIVIDREDYFYRSRLHDRCKVVIAEEGDKLVGIMAYSIKEVVIDGKEDLAAYFYDLRGEATYRRSMKRGLFRLWRTVRQEMTDAGAAFIYGHVKADNHESMNITTKMGGQAVASFDILALPALKGPVPDLDPHLGNLEEEVARMSDRVKSRSLRPLRLEDSYLRGAELGYLHGIYRVESGNSSAQVSAWDLSKIYVGRVLHMPMHLNALRTVLNPLSRVFPVPRVPKVGEGITYLQLFDPVCVGPEGGRLLKQLIQSLRRLAYAKGITIVTLFAYRDDPLIEWPRFFPEEVLHYNTMVVPLCKENLPTPPLYLDIRDI